MAAHNRKGASAMRNHKMLIAFEPEDWAMVQSIPKYKRSKQIREAMRQAGLIRPLQTENLSEGKE